MVIFLEQHIVTNANVVGERYSVMESLYVVEICEDLTMELLDVGPYDNNLREKKCRSESSET
jgi:hypothetical protein